MADIIIRPTMKFIYLGYFVVIVIVVGWVALAMHLHWPAWIPPALQPWIPWAPVVFLLWPLRRHLRNRLVKMTIFDDQVRYETGLFNKTTRMIQLSKVQDVTVHQGIAQRIFGVGDLSLETAGKTSWEKIIEIDRPQEIADLLTVRSKGQPANDQNP